VDRAAWVREVARVLRPDGRLVCGHWDWDSQLREADDKALVRRVVHAFADWKQERFPVPRRKRNSWFRQFARSTARLVGRPVAFATAAGVILAWAVTGPIFRFGDAWQLVINTGTTIVTFLTVFVIQNTQNRDADAVQVKLDERSRERPNALSARQVA
jgi:SAM-dependent methyltransferase